MDCRRKPKKKRCGHVGEFSNATLDDLVADFRRNHLLRLRRCLHKYSAMPLPSAVEFAAKAMNPDGSRHPHHTRRRKADLALAYTKLKAKTTAMQKCVDFDAIHATVTKIADTIKWLGTLYAYDCALILGARLRKMPDKVYLHSGTRQGARALGLKADGPFLPVPEKLRGLRPHEIEDFLCMYKDSLKPSMLA